MVNPKVKTVGGIIIPLGRELTYEEKKYIADQINGKKQTPHELHSAEFSFVSLRLLYKVAQKDREGRLNEKPASGRPTLFDAESKNNILQYVNSIIKSGSPLNQDELAELLKNELAESYRRKFQAMSSKAKNAILAQNKNKIDFNSTFTKRCIKRYTKLFEKEINKRVNKPDEEQLLSAEAVINEDASAVANKKNKKKKVTATNIENELTAASCVIN